MSKLFNSNKPIHNSALLIPVAAGEEGVEGWRRSARGESKAVSLKDEGGGSGSGRRTSG